MAETVNHPDHYGGKDNPYEAIKVIEAWQLGFCLGNTVKYISRAGKKDRLLEDLKKAAWYLNHEIEKIENSNCRPKTKYLCDRGWIYNQLTHLWNKGGETLSFKDALTVEKYNE